MSEHNWWNETNSLLKIENREQSGDSMLNNLLDIEGVEVDPLVSTNRSELDQLCINTFRTLLESKDPRWRLAYKMQRLKKEGILEDSQLEHALRSDYLSDHPSIRRGFGRYIDQVTIPQLARALANIEIGNAVKPRFETMFPANDFYECRYKTGSIFTDKETKVTGCHEAVWQLQLFEIFTKKPQYLGRVGFNFHWENDNKILSIANIQGASNSQEAQELFEEINGQGFNDFLVNLLQLKLGDEFVIRGVEGRPENKGMYKSTFKHANIPTYRVKRFYKEEYVPNFEDIFKLDN